MDVSVKEARDKLDELLDRAEAGEEVVLTREGRPPARIVVARPAGKTDFDRAVIDEITRRAIAEGLPGPDAAHSQDYLYDEFGLPN